MPVARVIEDIDDLSVARARMVGAVAANAQRDAVSVPRLADRLVAAFRAGSVVLERASAGGGQLAARRSTGRSSRRLLPLGISLSDYLDVLVDPEAERPAAALAALGR